MPDSVVHGDERPIKAADQAAPQGAANNTTVVIAIAGSVAGLMLVVSMLIVGKAWRTNKMKRQQEGVIIHNISGFVEVSTTKTESAHLQLLLCPFCAD